MERLFKNSISDSITLKDWFNFIDGKKSLNEKEKGTLFEYLCLYILTYNPIYRFEKVYLYNECPVNIINALNLPSTDKGLDLITVETIDGIVKYTGVQCKYRRYREQKISETCTATFSQQLLTWQISGIFMTNCYDINDCMKNIPNIRCIYGRYFDEIEMVYIIIREKILGLTRSDTIARYSLRPYQQECMDVFNRFLDDKYYTEDILYTSVKLNNKEVLLPCNTDAAILSMACGTGKTLILYHIAINAKNIPTNKTESTSVIIGVPSLQLLSQLYMNWMVYHYYNSDIDIETMIIGSSIDLKDRDIDFTGIDCTTDMNAIIERLNVWNLSKTEKKNIQKRKIHLIFTTYQSSRTLLSAINHIETIIDLVVFDEAHHMTGRISEQNSLVGYTIEKKDLKVKAVFATATPRHLYGTYNNIVVFPDDPKIPFVNRKGGTIYSMNDSSIFGHTLYIFNIRDAIDQGILCGYKIVSFVETERRLDRYIESNRLLKTLDDEKEYSSHHYMCAIMLLQEMYKDRSENRDIDNREENTRYSEIEKVFTYHSSVEDGKRFVKLLQHVKNILYPNSTEIYIDSIDGKVSMNRRAKILDNFRSSKLAILCSCRVLGEGIDIKECDTVMFIDGKNSTVDIVQSFGRCLRKHNRENGNVKRATILIPTMLDTDIENTSFDNIKSIIKTISNNDKEIVAYFKERIDGRNGNGKVSYRCTCIDDVDLDEIEIINLLDIEKFTNTKIYDIVDKWEIRLKELEEFLIENKKRPNIKSENINEGILSRWIHTQHSNYKKNKQSMKDNNKRLLWKTLVDRYIYLLGSKDQIWWIKFEIIKEYIEKNNKLPNRDIKFDDNKYIRRWIEVQLKNYINENDSMNKDKQPRQRELFESLIKKYPLLFKEKQKIKIDIKLDFFKKFEIIKEYIEKNNKRPTKDVNFDDDISMYSWLKKQITNYINKVESMDIDKYPERREQFESLIKRYPIIFKEKSEIKLDFFEKFEIVKEYIEKNNKRPSEDINFNDNTSIGRWIKTQFTNYRIGEKSMDKDKCLERRVLFESLIKRYPLLFKEKSEIKLDFFEKFEIIKEYIEKNNKIPSKNINFDDDKSVKVWVNTQIYNYKTNIKSMNKHKKPDQRKLFTELLRSYSDLFQDIVIDD